MAAPPATGRRRRRPAGRVALLLVVAAVAVAGTAWAWTASRGGDSEPQRLTPGQLAFAQEDYDGRRVRTEGVVRRFGPEEGSLRLHWVIEDEALNRTELVGGGPDRHVGRTVVVVGTFRFTEAAGRSIDVETIEPR